jgi:PAS domain S-box-containing protein
MTQKKNLHVLMLEDDPLDADLNKVQLLLLDEYNCIVQWVVDRESYLKALETDPDIILSDYSLPQYNGLEALKDLKERNPIIPFVFVTGTINEETAVDTIKAGAWDYVVKDRLFRLPLAIRNVLKLKEEKINTLKAEELNRKLSMAVEQSPVHIIIININGKIEYVNTRFTEVTGYLPEEVIGMDPRIFIPGNYNDENIGTFWENLTTGQSWRGETIGHKKDGTVFWEYNSISPLKDENGDITHIIVVKEDISQRKHMEQELIAALDRAERSDKLKEVFLQNLSHEIRTPMNAIVGFAGLLNEPNIPADQQKEFKSIILNSSNQLLSIVSDILTVSRIQTGQEEVVIRPAVLNDIMENLYVVFRPIMQAKNLSFNVHKNIENPIILTDDTKLIQILTNLLSNAVKFTHTGSVDLNYTISGENLIFTVKDTGIGIAKEFHEFIFERFRQANTLISTNYGGTGLGLAISKSFAEMLGGSVKVDSALGKGSTFSLIIPFKRGQLIKREAGVDHNVLQIRDVTILIAEDEEYNYQLLKAYLADKFVLLYARNGKEAIEICKEHPEIALILMDIKMPAINGQVALSEIRKFRPQLPCIAQTAYALVHERQQFLNYGFNDYIAKPIKKEELMEKVQQLLVSSHF